MLAQILKSRWFAASVHAGLWLLLYLTVAGMATRTPDFGEADSFSTPVQSPAPVAKLADLFSPGNLPTAQPDTNLLSAFATLHFIPPKKPAPPPPTTRKIQLTYQGFYQTVDGPKHTLIKMGDALLVTPVGATVATHLFVADATMQTLTLTNLAAESNILSLNTSKEIEIPIE
jgi:hypothetical protein